MTKLTQLFIFIPLALASQNVLSLESFCPGGSNPDPKVIFCDSFEQPGVSSNKPEKSKYYSFTDSIGQFNRVSNESIDGSQSLQYTWINKGDVEGGYFQLNFGANPLGSNINPNKNYREIFWRFYVKLPQNFVGYPAKLTRARGFANANGAESMLAHIWSDGANPQFLKLDPATGIKNNQLVTTKWNDQLKFTWLGSVRDNNPFPKGEWVCLEAHVKLNDASLANGTFDLKINEQIVASKTGINWVGSWNNYGINSILFSNYWNSGAAANNQVRYLDAIVVSESQIGCLGSISAVKPMPPYNLTVAP